MNRQDCPCWKDMRETLDYVLVTMRHARLFIRTRERMHPTGIDLWDELVKKLEEYEPVLCDSPDQATPPEQGGVKLSECLGCANLKVLRKVAQRLVDGDVMISDLRHCLAKHSAPTAPNQERVLVQSMPTWLCGECVLQWKMSGREAPKQERDGLSEKYHELLFEVCRRYPGESRHETAKRYIHEAENRCDEGAACETHTTPQAKAGDEKGGAR